MDRYAVKGTLRSANRRTDCGRIRTVGLRALALLAAITTATVIAGCSSGADSEAGDQGTTAASAQFPVTIETKHGDTDIAAAPQRIVTLGNPALENVVALGQTPVAANVTKIEAAPYLSEYRDQDYLDATLADIYGNEVNVEAIAAKSPDLIVVPSWPVFTEPTVLDRLRELAPTLVFDTQDADTDWRVGVEQVAKALGLEAKGKELVDAAVAKYTEVGQALPSLATKPYSFGLYTAGSISLASGGNVLGRFGLEPAADQKSVENDGTQVTYAEENYSEVNGEIVLLMPYPQEAKEQMERSPLWESSLKGRVLWLTDAQGEAINNAGILGKTWLPGNIKPLLESIAN